MADAESFLAKETEQFRTLYMWLSQSFPPELFKEIGEEPHLLLAHSLVGFKLQDYYSAINFASSSLVLSRNVIDSDFKIFKQYEARLISSMQTYVSEKPLPGEEHSIRITRLSFVPEEIPLSEKAKSLIEQAKNCDYTLCELVRAEGWMQPQRHSLTLSLACSHAPHKAYVGRLFKTLIANSVALGNYRLFFTSAQTLYFEAELQGIDDRPCWEVCNVEELMKELLLVRDFAVEDLFEETFARSAYGDGALLVFLRSVSGFVQQLLVHLDLHMYSLENVQEAFCYWPELAKNLFELFCRKCDPFSKDLESFLPLRQKLLDEISKQDTGKESADIRRKTCLRYGLLFVDSILKTNFFCRRLGAVSYRIDPAILAELREHFPEMPFGIFYLYSRDFFGFHIRFQDLARGGMRTLVMKTKEAALEEASSTFLECYQLAWTQEKKNKDIPEGGAKAICFLFPDTDAIAHLYRSQRLFIEGLLQLVIVPNPLIVDYYGMPEYLYLGPDENMHDVMIEWIADFAKKIGYLPGSAFITSKPKIGINHKRYGVTSLGVNVCMQEVLNTLGIDPTIQSFTVKMAGGPDGDVAGNQILNLHKYYLKTAKLLSLIDISGVIYDPEGLDLSCMKELFLQGLPIGHFPPEKLHPGSFLLDLRAEKREAVHIVKIRLVRKVADKVVEEWISGTDAQDIVKSFVHKTKADVFIPAGGRPATLNSLNVHDFLDESGMPTSKAIIEGANLYLTPDARALLEEKGVIIIKDSSANKGGVICSSFEVISSLALSDEEFLRNKDEIVKEILDKIEQYAKDEVRLILQTHHRTQERCSQISERISERINLYRSQIRDYLHPLALGDDPYMRCFFEHCLPLLATQFQDTLIRAIPDVHKKAIIASWIASKVVYLRGLDWSPTIVDVLPFLIQDPRITSCPI